ncbi:MAG: hypothetical protein DMG38_15205 [Acidobacteria bacterium]|nr:MAG: hypothetical protein DMG38_15205 [Acidobacteriota bacterium]
MGRRTPQLYQMGRTSAEFRGTDSLNNAFQHPAGDRATGGKNRGALEPAVASATSATVRVSPAPPLHRFVPSASRRVRGLQIEKASHLPKNERIVLRL